MPDFAAFPVHSVWFSVGRGEKGMKNSWVDLRLWMSGGTKKEESRRRGQERKVWRQRGGWRDRSVYVSSFIHHTVPLWFNQTRNVFTKFDSGSTSECVAMQAPARQKYHPVKLKPLIKAIRSPKEAHRARLSLKWFLDKWLSKKIPLFSKASVCGADSPNLFCSYLVYR